MKRLIILLLIVGCEQTVEPEDVYGCTDSTACNFDVDATIFDDSCIYDVVKDCADVCGGDAELDCEGVCNGDAYEDNCGTCDSYSTNDCTQDCTDMLDGSAYYNSCGTACPCTCENPRYCFWYPYIDCSQYTSPVDCDLYQDCYWSSGSCNVRIPPCTANCVSGCFCQAVYDNNTGSCVDSIEECSEVYVYGCQDESACNYNPEATVNVGCLYCP